MKVVIFAGGLGTRLSEETDLIPKPMVRIGDKPIIWHIMKTYAYFGHTEFILLLGYKGEIIQDYFEHNAELWPDWKITFLYDKPNSKTGGALLNASKFIDGAFFCTYGDGVSDIYLPDLIKLHNQTNKIVTLTATQIDGKFGALEIEGDTVKNFWEKPKKQTWVSTGFYIMEPEIFSKIEKNDTVLESEVLSRLAKENQVSAYRHYGYWQPMDTLRDKRILEEQWQTTAPWKVWQNE